MSPVDVVVVGYRCRDLLLSCCAALAQAGDVRVIVVDNASGDGSGEAVRAAFPSVKVIENSHNEGFARAVNRGAACGDGDSVLLLNPDARIDRGSLERLARTLADDATIGAIGPRIHAPDGALELSVDRTMSLGNDVWIRLLELLYAGGHGPAAPLVRRTYARARDVRSLSAACLLARRAALQQVGGLDERFFLYAEDVDLCLRLRRAGWRLRYEPAAEATHVRGVSGRADPEAVERAWRASQSALYRKHRSALSTALLRSWVLLHYRIAAYLGAGERRRRARRMLEWLRERHS